MIFVFILIISLFVVFGIFSFNSQSSLYEIIIWIFTLMILLVLFDSFFIDLFLIEKLRPSFLEIPNEPTIETMRIHVVKTFTLGWIFIIPMVFISVLIVHNILK
jgi:hypothetical protein